MADVDARAAAVPRAIRAVLPELWFTAAGAAGVDAGPLVAHVHRWTDVLGALGTALGLLAGAPGALLAAGLESPTITCTALGVSGRLALVRGVPFTGALEELEAAVLVPDETTADVRGLTLLAWIVAVVVGAAAGLDAVAGPLAVCGALHIPAVGGVAVRAGLDEARGAVDQVRDRADPGHAVEALAALVAQAAFRLFAGRPAALVRARDDSPSVAAAAVRVEGAGLALPGAGAVSRAGPAVLGGSLAGSVATDRGGAGPVGAEEALPAEAAGPAAAVGAAVLIVAGGPGALPVLALVAAAGLHGTVHSAEAPAAVGTAGLAATGHQGVDASAGLAAGLALVCGLLPVAAAVLPPRLGVGLAGGLEVGFAAHSAQALLVLSLIAAASSAGEPVGVLERAVVHADVAAAAVGLTGAIPAVDFGTARDRAALLARTKVHLHADAEDLVAGGRAGAFTAGISADALPAHPAVAGVVVDTDALDAVLVTRIAEPTRPAAAVGAAGRSIAAMEDAGAALTLLRATALAAGTATSIVAALQPLALRVAAMRLEAGGARGALAVRRAARTGLAVGVIADTVSAACVAVLGTRQAGFAARGLTNVVAAALATVCRTGAAVLGMRRLALSVTAQGNAGAIGAFRPGRAGTLAGAVLVVAHVFCRVALRADAVVSS